MAHRFNAIQFNSIKRRKTTKLGRGGGEDTPDWVWQAGSTLRPDWALNSYLNSYLNSLKLNSTI